MSHKSFRASAQGKSDFSVPVEYMKIAGFGEAMVIMTPEAAIYISEEQAMEFFGLIKTEYIPKVGDILTCNTDLFMNTGDGEQCFTAGKEYEIISFDEDGAVLIDDEGDQHSISTWIDEHFEVKS